MLAQRRLAGVLAAVFACGGAEGPDPACFEHIGDVLVPEQSDVPLQGKVTLRDRDTRTLGGDGRPQSLREGRVQATFFDVSTRTATEAAFMQLSDECVGRISRGVPATGLTPLSIAALEVRGTARGVVRAVEMAPGIYADSGAPILSDGPLEVVGETNGEFPGFDQTIEPPDPVVLAEPLLDGSALVELGDLTIAWNRGNGDFVVLVIDPDQTTGAESGGDVICVIPDDGCHTLPAAVAVFLLASQSETFTLIVARERHRTVSLDARAFLEIESVAELRGTLKNGALR